MNGSTKQHSSGKAYQLLLKQVADLELHNLSLRVTINKLTYQLGDATTQLIEHDATIRLLQQELMHLVNSPEE